MIGLEETGLEIIGLETIGLKMIGLEMIVNPKTDMELYILRMYKFLFAH